jgi:hypothetical protein
VFALGPGHYLKQRIHTMKNKRAGLTVVFAVVISFLLFGAVAGGGESGDDGDLSQYFGFGAMEILKLHRGISKPVVVDLNRDGVNDMVVVNNRKSRIELLLGKKDFVGGGDISLEPEEEDINDIFGKERNWRFKRVSYPLDVAASSFVVADLNDDGFLDLAFYSKEGLYVVFQEKGGDSAEVVSWRPGRKIDIREGLSARRALAAGDLNGDGKTDLALLANDGVFLLRQQGDGTFPEPVKYHSSSNKLKQIL